jgi:hypothetical protein
VNSKLANTALLFVVFHNNFDAHLVLNVRSNSFFLSGYSLSSIHDSMVFTSGMAFIANRRAYDMGCSFK